MPEDPFPGWNPFDAPGKYVPPPEETDETTQVHVSSPRNKSALVLSGREKERTLESLLADESTVLLAAEFMGLNPMSIAWGTEKGQPFIVGPKTPSHPEGIIYMLSEMLHAQNWRASGAHAV
jgi:hypothetical protein